MNILLIDCQVNIGDHEGLYCTSCNITGPGNCDPTGCPAKDEIRHEIVIYNNYTKMCEMCQRKIGDHLGVNCESCNINGPGKCDPGGCPARLTYYNSRTELCEEETMNRTCKRGFSSYKCQGLIFSRNPAKRIDPPKSREKSHPVKL